MKNLVNRLKGLKNISRSGLGEMLGFILVVPGLVLILAMLLTIGELTIYKQKLTYMAYNMARSAVVSSTPNEAKDNASAMMHAAYGDQFVEIMGVEDPGHVAALFNSLQNHQVCGEMSYIKDDAEWEKGTVIRCSVYQKAKPLIAFVGEIRSESIVMMIENQAEETH